MRKNTANTLKAFEARREYGKSGDSIWTDGRRIYSYFTCIVDRDPETLEAIITNVSYSTTTSAHVNAIAANIGAHTFANLDNA